MRGLAAALLLPYAAGHGSMNYPPSRTGGKTGQAMFGAEGSYNWYQEGCQAGCPNCTGGPADTLKGGCYGITPGLAHEKCCNSVTEPTLADGNPYLTWSIQEPDMGPFCGLLWPCKPFVVSRYNPWRSPGHAPMRSPCGIKATNAPWDSDKTGLDMPELKGVKTVWPAGSKQDVAWTVGNNHGGGYAYRLCKKDDPLFPQEECFLNGHLEMAGDQSWIQYGDAYDAASPNRTAIPAVRFTEGTYKGKQWTRSPIPACAGKYGGSVAAEGCDAPQYPAPLAGVVHGYSGGGFHHKGGIYGFGPGRCVGVPPDLPAPNSPSNQTEFLCSAKERKFWKELFSFMVIDQVQIPKDLAPGDYVLSYRWDCEQTPQIWSNCADITITA